MDQGNTLKAYRAGGGDEDGHYSLAPCFLSSSAPVQETVIESTAENGEHDNKNYSQVRRNQVAVGANS